MPTEPARDRDFFISYASPDVRWAEWVAWHLHAAGYSVDLDVWTWTAGANFVMRISESLARSRWVVALFSPRYFEAVRFTREEWTAVVAASRTADRLIPLLIEPMERNAIPDVLRPSITVEMFGLTQDEAKERLLRAVTRDPAPVPTEAPPFPGTAPPARPDGRFGTTAASSEPASSEPVASAPPAPPAPAAAAAGPEEGPEAGPEGAPDPAAPPTGPAAPDTAATASTALSQAVVHGPRPGTLLAVHVTAGPLVSSPVVAGDLVLVGGDDGLLHAVRRIAPGEVPEPGGPAEPGTLTQVWTAGLGGGPVRSTPAVLGGAVLAAGRATLHARDLATGAGLWAVVTGAPCPARPVPHAGTLFAVTDADTVHALDPADGSARWRAALPPGAERDLPLAAAPCPGPDGSLLVAGRSGDLIALDAATGAERWTRRIGGTGCSSPTVHEGTVLVGSEEGGLWALDALTGEPRWTYPAPGGVVSSPAVAGGTVHVGGFDGQVHAVDAATGARRWAFPTGRGVLGSPLVADGTVYVGGHDARLYALDAATGRVRWTCPVGGPVVGTPALADGVLYVGALDGRLHAVRA
jgi:outer membrane protein assembly factor BamB